MAHTARKHQCCSFLDIYTASLLHSFVLHKQRLSQCNTDIAEYGTQLLSLLIIRTSAFGSFWSSSAWNTSTWLPEIMCLSCHSMTIQGPSNWACSAITIKADRKCEHNYVPTGESICGRVAVICEEIQSSNYLSGSSLGLWMTLHVPG